MTIDTNPLLVASARRLFPDLEPDEVLGQLLMERAQRSLIKYQSLRQQFEVRYGVNFETFRDQILSTDPSFEEEQDYFDWEMAVTGIEDMTAEIEQLHSVLEAK